MSLARPKLEYCSSIWDPYHHEYKNKLESVQRRAARFVCRDFRRQSHVSDMLRDLNWKAQEDRRTIYRLTLLYKLVYNIVAINIDEHYTNYEERNIATRKTLSISFFHPTARKNCYRYSFIPRTVAEWNRLPATIREAHLLKLLRLDCAETENVHFVFFLIDCMLLFTDAMKIN